jgi:hypothetical protein
METGLEVWHRRIREMKAVLADPNSTIDQVADAQEGLRLFRKYGDMTVGDALKVLVPVAL